MVQTGNALGARRTVSSRIKTAAHLDALKGTHTVMETSNMTAYLAKVGPAVRPKIRKTSTNFYF